MLLLTLVFGLLVVAVMSTQEMNGVRSFAASNSFVEDLP
jgi:hypothetical protein